MKFFDYEDGFSLKPAFKNAVIVDKDRTMLAIVEPIDILMSSDELELMVEKEFPNLYIRAYFSSDVYEKINELEIDYPAIKEQAIRNICGGSIEWIWGQEFHQETDVYGRNKYSSVRDSDGELHLIDSGNYISVRKGIKCPTFGEVRCHRRPDNSCIEYWATQFFEIPESQILEEMSNILKSS